MVSEHSNDPLRLVTHSYFLGLAGGFCWRARSLHRRRRTTQMNTVRRRYAHSSEPRVGALAMDDCDVDPRRGACCYAHLVSRQAVMDSAKQTDSPPFSVLSAFFPSRRLLRAHHCPQAVSAHSPYAGLFTHSRYRTPLPVMAHGLEGSPWTNVQDSL